MIAIPPHAKRNLTDYRWVKRQKGNYAEIVEYPEEFLWNLDAAGLYEGYVYYDEVKTFSEDNSPFYRSFLIAYSKQADFATYSLASIHFYIREIIGWHYPESIKESTKNVRRYHCWTGTPATRDSRNQGQARSQWHGLPRRGGHHGTHDDERDS